MNGDGDHNARGDVTDLLALGAAGALSADEYRALDELLRGDPQLAAEYRDLQESAATLAQAASEPPPAALRASVLDAITNVEQLPPPPASGAAEDSAPVPEQELETARARPTIVPIHHRRWMLPATAAAAVLMLLLTGLLINRSADAPGDQMAAVLNDDRAVMIPLSGELDGLRLVASQDAGAAVILGSAVAMPARDMVFQLWAIYDDQKVGMATFRPAATGEVAMLVDGIPDESEWAITMEPEGGSDQPTSDPVAVSPGLP